MNACRREVVVARLIDAKVLAEAAARILDRVLFLLDPRLGSWKEAEAARLHLTRLIAKLDDEIARATGEKQQRIRVIEEAMGLSTGEAGEKMPA